MAVDPLAQFSAKSADRILEPIDRISEVLFGLIMALTFTLTLGVVTADRIQVRTMLLAALGCNLAWGIIDASVFLMARFNQRGRNAVQLRAVRAAADIADAHRIIANALPPLLGALLPPDQLELIRQSLLQLPEPEGPRLTKRDGLGAMGICLLSFLSTLRRPSLQPVAGVEHIIASEIEVSFALTDWKEKPDLRSNSGNARPEPAEHGTRAAIAGHLVVDIADGTDVQFVGEIRRNRPIQMCVDAAAVLGVGIDEVVG